MSQKRGQSNTGNYEFVLHATEWLWTAVTSFQSQGAGSKAKVDWLPTCLTPLPSTSAVIFPRKGCSPGVPALFPFPQCSPALASPKHSPPSVCQGSEQGSPSGSALLATWKRQQRSDSSLTGSETFRGSKVHSCDREGLRKSFRVGNLAVEIYRSKRSGVWLWVCVCVCEGGERASEQPLKIRCIFPVLNKNPTQRGEPKIRFQCWLKPRKVCVLCKYFRNI